MSTRIYIVTGPGKPRLVRAPNRAQALKHVAANTFKVEVANQNTLIELLSKHVDIENSKPEQADIEDQQANSPVNNGLGQIAAAVEAA